MKLKLFAAFLFVFFFSVNVCAKNSAVPKEDFPVTAQIPAGGSEDFTVHITKKGSVVFTVGTDSSEGYIYMYDKRGHMIENIYYTKSDMPLTIREDVKKGDYTIEVTRTPSSTGSGETSVDMKFSMDVSSAMRDAVIIFTALFTSAVAAAVMIPQWDRTPIGRLKIRTENGKMYFEERSPMRSLEKAEPVRDTLDKLFRR